MSRRKTVAHDSGKPALSTLKFLAVCMQVFPEISEEEFEVDVTGEEGRSGPSMRRW